VTSLQSPSSADSIMNIVGSDFGRDRGGETPCRAASNGLFFRPLYYCGT
jgi:hypothetical protein